MLKPRTFSAEPDKYSIGSTAGRISYSSVDHVTVSPGYGYSYDVVRDFGERFFPRAMSFDPVLRGILHEDDASLTPGDISQIIFNANVWSEERIDRLEWKIGKGIAILAKVEVAGTNVTLETGLFVAHREVSVPTPLSKPGWLAGVVSNAKNLLPDRVYPSISGGVMFDHGPIMTDSTGFVEYDDMPNNQLIAELIGLRNAAGQFLAQRGTLKPGICVYLLKGDPNIRIYEELLKFKELGRDIVNKQEADINDAAPIYGYNRFVNLLESSDEQSGKKTKYPLQEQVRLWHPNPRQLIEEIDSYFRRIGLDINQY